MNNKSFDTQRIAEGYAKRPWLHQGVMKQIQDDCDIKTLENGLDVGCGAGLSTKALRLICNHVTGTDISPEMIFICKKLYPDESYNFYVAKAEETVIPEKPYNIITAAGVVNWVDRERFLLNAGTVLKPSGLIVVYDFWITDKMMQNEEYTKWYNEQYLIKFPKPYRKENVWQQNDLSESFIMEKQTKYYLQYDFEIDEFVDFMMIQSNVNEAIGKGYASLQEVRDWMRKGLHKIFDNEKRTLVFEGYNWYIRKL